MRRAALALVASLALSAAVRAADLPVGTWAVNIDGKKGDLLITQIKDGKATGALLGTDFAGSWNGKELKFQSGDYTFEAQLVSEPGDDGKTKYTLTGSRLKEVDVSTRARFGVHVVKSGGWYAQISAKPPTFGDIVATVRGVLTFDGNSAYVTVKPDADAPEMKVWFRPPADQWAAFRMNNKNFADREVIVTGKLGQLVRPGAGAMGDGALYFVGTPDIKEAPKK
jgi:hypothetical protein